jgi:ribA/ribD-fused uncharacterized protein
MMIKEFNGKYDWLSNFAPCEINLYGFVYPSVEHAYQSCKCDSEKWKNYCQVINSPGLVKRMSKKVDLVKNWNKVKVVIMQELIDIKFDKEPFKSLLLETKDVYIQEGNKWNDTFWGVNLNTGKGKNILGKLIMEKRNRLKIENMEGLIFDIIKGNTNKNKYMVYKDKNESFFVFKGNIFEDIESVREYIDKIYDISLSDVDFIKMDENTEAFWKNVKNNKEG